MDTISSPSTLSHLRDGRVSMVDVGGKDVTVRVAVARADMVLPPEVSAYFSQHGCMRSPKGAITDMATVAAVMGAKKTADLVPLCHNITLTNVQLEVSLPQPQRLRLEATVSSRAQTGVEMEALTAVSMAALTVYDMCKSLSHNISIQDLHLVSKSGGKSDFFPPDLQALILCGGASKRMGREKFLLRYHEQLQWEHLLQMVQKLGGRVFVSCRQDQLPNFPGDCPVLVDDPSVLRPGPARAMLSAHRRFPDIAWFLIACDLPLLTEESVHSLCQARARDAWATAVFNEKTGFFEPLFAIWESRGLGAFAEQSTTCVACPSQFLKRNHTYVHLVSLPNYDELLNANTPACRKHVEEVIARRKASVAPSAQR